MRKCARIFQQAVTVCTLPGLGPVVAMAIAGLLGIPIVTVDPPSADEFHVRLPGMARKRAFHALSQKAGARKAAKEKGMRYEDCRFVVAHLGGGITVGAHLFYK